MPQESKRHSQSFESELLFDYLGRGKFFEKGICIVRAGETVVEMWFSTEGDTNTSFFGGRGGHDEGWESCLFCVVKTFTEKWPTMSSELFHRLNKDCSL